MDRNVFLQESKLRNVSGRITYISSTVKQENLYAVYETTERPFWNKLAKQNRKDFVKSGSSGECIEARESHCRKNCSSMNQMNCCVSMLIASKADTE